MSDQGIVIVVIAVGFTATAALTGTFLWLTRDLIALNRDTLDTVSRAVDDSLESARLAAATTQSISSDLLAALDVASESQRALAVDLITTALIGPTVDASDRPPDDRPDGTEPPEAIIVDSELDDPSDVWLPDKALDAIVFPPPINDMPVEGIARSGQAGPV